MKGEWFMDTASARHPPGSDGYVPAPRVGIVKYGYYGAFRLAPGAISYKYGVHQTQSRYIYLLSQFSNLGWSV
jgi:hypothetical protein